MINDLKHYKLLLAPINVAILKMLLQTKSRQEPRLCQDKTLARPAAICCTAGCNNSQTCFGNIFQFNGEIMKYREALAA